MVDCLTADIHKLNEPKLVSVCTQCSGVLTTQAYTQAAHTHHNQSRRDTHGTSTLHGEDTGRPPTFAPQVSEEQLLVLSFCSVSGSEWHSECCVRSSGALTDVIAKIDQPRQGRCAADLLRRAGSTLRRYSGRFFCFVFLQWARCTWQTGRRVGISVTSFSVFLSRL